MHKHMANQKGIKLGKATCWYHEQRQSCRHMTSKNLLQHGLTALLYLKFIRIKQHEVPFTDVSEATKGQETKIKQRMANVLECTNVTNWKSHVGLSTPFYTTCLWFCSRNPADFGFSADNGNCDIQFQGCWVSQPLEVFAIPARLGFKFIFYKWSSLAAFHNFNAHLAQTLEK